MNYLKKFNEALTEEDIAELERYKREDKAVSKIKDLLSLCFSKGIATGYKISNPNANKLTFDNLEISSFEGVPNDMHEVNEFVNDKVRIIDDIIKKIH